MKVYFISGLAADKRVFRHIRLPEGHEIVHLDWINPYPHESLSDYARRLGEKIDQSESFAIAGLSLGGMMAVEMARHYSPRHTILISSVPTHQHLPWYFRWSYKLRLHQVVPISFMKKSAIAKRLFTSETSEDKKVLYSVIKESDPVFIKWAMNAVLTWNAEASSTSCIHIHGTRDEILPMRYTRPTHIVKGAGHMMIMTRAAEINRILKELLEPEVC